MWRSIKREISVNRAGIWQSMLILAGTCLLGEIVVTCIFRLFMEEPEFIPMGLVLSAVTAVVCAVIFPAYYFSCGYEQALTMGCTRGRFLVGAFALSAVHILALLFSACLAFAVDLGYYRLFYPAAFAGIDWAGFEPDLSWLGVLLLIVAALLCVGVFMGACLQRWGRKAFWILWGVYMGGVFLSGPFLRLGSSDAANTSPLGRMFHAVGSVLAMFPMAGYIGLAGALLLAAGVAGIVLLLRGSIRHAV